MYLVMTSLMMNLGVKLDLKSVHYSELSPTAFLLLMILLVVVAAGIVQAQSLGLAARMTRELFEVERRSVQKSKYEFAWEVNATTNHQRHRSKAHLYIVEKRE